jgi:hypothetical protein
VSASASERSGSGRNPPLPNIAYSGVARSLSESTSFTVFAPPPPRPPLLLLLLIHHSVHLAPRCHSVAATADPREYSVHSNTHSLPPPLLLRRVGNFIPPGQRLQPSLARRAALRDWGRDGTSAQFEADGTHSTHRLHCSVASARW